MHDLTPILLNAWRRLLPSLNANPDDLAKRLDRRNSKSFSRWPRAWCLAIRAADRRIDAWHNWNVADHSYCGDGHTVVLTSDLVRYLVRRVFIDPPCLEQNEVAEKLGTHRATLNHAIKRGVFESYRTIPLLGGKHGPAVPVIYTKKPLDPGWGAHRRGPHPIWGTDTRRLCDHVPDKIQQSLTRIPIWRLTPPPRNRGAIRPRPTPDYAAWYKWTKDGQYLGDPGDERRAHNRQRRRELLAERRAEEPAPSRDPIWMFRGYFWLCPVCHRKARNLYYPIELFPPIQLLDKDFVLPPRLQPKSPTQSFLPGQAQGFSPGSLGARRTAPLKRFACNRCHNLADFPMAHPRKCWNQLITRLSDGLLYGHEVPMPCPERPAGLEGPCPERPAGVEGPCPERPAGVEGLPSFLPQRTRDYKPRLHARPALRRDHVRARLLQGFTPHQIAHEMKLKPITVYKYATEIYRQSKTRTLREFLAKQGHPRPPLKRDLVAQRILLGESIREISLATGLSPRNVSLHLLHLRRRHKVTTPQALITALRAALPNAEQPRAPEHSQVDERTPTAPSPSVPSSPGLTEHAI